MQRKLSFSAIRDGGPRAARWLGFVLIGVIGGAVLGEMAVGKRLGRGSDAPASYSHLSANPGALVAPDEGAAAPCPGCADSYGVAARLRADRENRMDDAFRDLGAVDIDMPPPEPADDGYRYGGRFPDQPSPGESPAAAVTEAPVDVPIGKTGTSAGEE